LRIPRPFERHRMWRLELPVERRWPSLLHACVLVRIGILFVSAESMMENIHQFPNIEPDEQNTTFVIFRRDSNSSLIGWNESVINDATVDYVQHAIWENWFSTRKYKLPNVESIPRNWKDVNDIRSCSF
jgi:hypothetical protein